MKSLRLTNRLYLLVAWYDLWVGVFVNTPKKHLYLFPVPCVGLLYCYGK
jgi:hypothetical protein